MAQWGWQFGRMVTDDTKEDESGTYALHTLKENETIARLATGIKRFDLPDEFNYIKIYQQIAAEPKWGQEIVALERLGQIFENRRQYPKAADYWRELIKRFGNQPQHRHPARADCGQLGPVRADPDAARRPRPSLLYRFRNGEEVEFTAKEIDVKKLLDDVKEYLRSSPRELDWQKINIGDIGYRLVQEKQSQYVGRQVAQWQMPLVPHRTTSTSSLRSFHRLRRRARTW